MDELMVPFWYRNADDGELYSYEMTRKDFPNVLTDPTITAVYLVWGSNPKRNLRAMPPGRAMEYVDRVLDDHIHAQRIG